MEITYTPDLTGAAKLEAVAQAWGVVQNENKNDRQWVTDDQWNQWVEYDKATAAKLSEIIERFNGVRLSDEDHKYLDDLIARVANTKRISAAEFAEQRRLEILAEMERKRQEEEAQKNKKALTNFKSTLKGLFKSK